MKKTKAGMDHAQVLPSDDELKVIVTNAMEKSLTIDSILACHKASNVEQARAHAILTDPLAMVFMDVVKRLSPHSSELQGGGSGGASTSRSQSTKTKLTTIDALQNVTSKCERGTKRSGMSVAEMSMPLSAVNSHFSMVALMWARRAAQQEISTGD